MTQAGPFDTTVGGDLVDRFVAVTGAPAALVLVARIFEVQERARPLLVPGPIQAAAVGGVHGEHDLVVHRAIVPDEPLRTWVDLHGVRPAGGNAAVTLRYTTVDGDDAVVAEQWWTTVLFGAPADPDGEAAPDHRFPDAARARPLAATTVDVDVDLARRYAEVSGDWSGRQGEVEAARASGADRPFLHGLCTMALCAGAVAGREPDRLRRIAVRFASTTPLGEALEVVTFDLRGGAVAVEATAAGTTVISHGRVERRG
jgi:acyl dehydratase